MILSKGHVVHAPVCHENLILRAGCALNVLPGVMHFMLPGVNSLALHFNWLYKCTHVLCVLICKFCLSFSVLNELLCKVRDHIGCLHKLSECTAMLDMLHSFAHAATLSNYGQPIQ